MKNNKTKKTYRLGLFTLAFLGLSISYASYQLKYPLEGTSGGALPVGSIHFENSPVVEVPTIPETPAEPKIVTVCTNYQTKDESNTMNTFFRINKNNGMISAAKWKGNTLSLNGEGKYSSGEYTYSVSGTALGTIVINNYNICQTGPEAAGSVSTAQFTSGVATNSGAIYNCNWSPAPSEFPSGTNFIQSASTCKQNQTRTNYDYTYNTFNMSIISRTPIVIESTIDSAQSITQSAIGTKPRTTDSVECKSGGNYGWSNSTDTDEFGGLGWGGIFYNRISPELVKVSDHEVIINGITYTSGAALGYGSYEVCQHY